MFKIKHLLILSFTIILLGTAGCKSKFEKLRLSNDVAKKYQEGIRLYNKKDYSKALILFEGLAQKYRGTAEAEDLNYYYAFTLYRLKDYTTARYKFKEFADTYPASKNAEECRYMGAYCYYLDSPKSSLDQENTYKAIDALQLFINLYPKSDRATQAAQYISDLRNKLETKAFDNAKLYYTMGAYDISNYKAAVIALKTAQTEFPDIKFAEEMNLLIVKAQYMYAKNSYANRQEERFNEAIGYYNEFIEGYPNSKLAKEAKQLKEDSEAGIANAKNVLAEEAALIAKYTALENQGKKQKDSTNKKVEIKTPIK
ncbi:outer membrane protein assembly factor BamD [Pedobacter frigiditerrae]|uniref:Outer membrane protein assembly factor BamD n=1 Tax=Pedobacter frigiditerrae TaxID=2530452 RepID=A0A4R0MJW4_9SPHI|nr:outer membrane protein assembly factor BamD [Pedobacter frigiditerrae]TCC86898.1 outer membrane protein assembly factor BamD [Pedobacter frigiditerrae]